MLTHATNVYNIYMTKNITGKGVATLSTKHSFLATSVSKVVVQVLTDLCSVMLMRSHIQRS
jgi:hypothetical protein